MCGFVEFVDLFHVFAEAADLRGFVKAFVCDVGFCGCHMMLVSQLYAQWKRENVLHHVKEVRYDVICVVLLVLY